MLIQAVQLEVNGGWVAITLSEKRKVSQGDWTWFIQDYTHIHPAILNEHLKPEVLKSITIDEMDLKYKFNRTKEDRWLNFTMKVRKKTNYYDFTNEKYYVTISAGSGDSQRVTADPGKSLTRHNWFSVQTKVPVAFASYAPTFLRRLYDWILPFAYIFLVIVLFMLFIMIYKLMRRGKATEIKIFNVGVVQKKVSNSKKSKVTDVPSRMISAASRSTVAPSRTGAGSKISEMSSGIRRGMVSKPAMSRTTSAATKSSTGMGGASAGTAKVPTMSHLVSAVTRTASPQND